MGPTRFDWNIKKSFDLLYQNETGRNPPPVDTVDSQPDAETEPGMTH